LLLSLFRPERLLDETDRLRYVIGVRNPSGLELYEKCGDEVILLGVVVLKSEFGEPHRGLRFGELIPSNVCDDRKWLELGLECALLCPVEDHIDV
jgi:hypothetical protein